MTKFVASAYHLSYPLFISLLLLISNGSSLVPVKMAEQRIINNNTIFSSQADVRAYAINPRSLVTFSFDDAGQSVYDTAFPILNSQDIPATFYFTTSFLVDHWKIQLKNLENHGWEIGSHTRTHPYLGTLSTTELITELSGSKSDLEAAGLTVSGFAYPYGADYHRDIVFRQVKQYYAYARSVNPGYNTPLIKQYTLKTQIVTSSTPLATMKSWVDEAIANRQWLIFTLHTVDMTGDLYSISPANLSELASYIKAKVDAGNISPVTVREGVTRYNQTYWDPIYSPNYSVQNDLAITNGRVLWYFGPDVIDYLSDGYEWVESGKVRYYEWNGQYRTIHGLSDVALQFISPTRANVLFTLRSADEAARVLSEVTLVPGSPMAQVRITAIQGTPTTLSLGKDLTRRFSINDGLLVTDGSIETGLRNYGDNSQDFFSFDNTTNLIRIMTHFSRKFHSEYSDYPRGEFRSRPISKATELPFTWFVGGTIFDTLSLLSEAEAATWEGGSAFYAGADASPKKGNTGVELDTNNESVTIQFIPPVQGNYTLSIRQKGITADAKYSYQIDGGEIYTRPVTGVDFGYENITLKDLSVPNHTMIIRQVSGTVAIDYILLIPTSRSSYSPAAAEFPTDIAHQIFPSIFLPLVQK